MRTLLSVFILSIGLASLSYSQINQELTSPFFSPADSQKLCFGLKNTNFFKNNEYFNPLNEGLTLLGYIVEPTVIYYPSATTRLEAGVNLQKFAGSDGIYKAQPVLRFQYMPVPWFQMVMGSIYGGRQHQLIEPLYKWEREIIHPVENGIQFLFKTDRVRADVWLEWEKFIQPRDSFQEELLFGSSLQWKILPGDRDFNLYLPLQTTVGHHGGQDLSVDLPLLTIANWGGAIKAEWQTKLNWVKSLTAECWYLGYTDLSPQKKQAFKGGQAIFPKIQAQIKGFTIQAGYFCGRKYESLKGEPLFSSASISGTSNQFANKNLIIGKLLYGKQVAKGIKLAAYAETYTDPKNSFNDYDYGVQITLEREFFLHSVK